MAIDFPNSPVVGETFSVGARSWSWTGVAWVNTSTRFGVNIDGGSPSSVFTVGQHVLDGGTP